MNGCSGCGIGSTADAIAAGIRAGADIVNIASGAPKQAERASRNALETARLNAAAASGNAAAQVEIARIQAETARLQAGASSGSGGKSTMIAAAIGGVALLGVLGFVLLKK